MNENPVSDSIIREISGGAMVSFGGTFFINSLLKEAIPIPIVPELASGIIAGFVNPIPRHRVSSLAGAGLALAILLSSTRRGGSENTGKIESEKFPVQPIPKIEKPQAPIEKPRVPKYKILQFLLTNIDQIWFRKDPIDPDDYKKINWKQVHRGGYDENFINFEKRLKKIDIETAKSLIIDAKKNGYEVEVLEDGTNLGIQLKNKFLNLERELETRFDWKALKGWDYLREE